MWLVRQGQGQLRFMNKTASTRGREQENKRMDGKGKAYTYFTLTRAIVKRDAPAELDTVYS